MTTTIVFGDASDGAVGSLHNDYATARAGSGLVADSTANTLTVTLGGFFPARVGQEGGSFYIIGEGFVAFDIDAAAIPSGDQITDVDLVLHQVEGAVSAAFTIEAREHDWGATLTTADWVPGADLGGLDLLATLAATTDSDTLRTFTPSGSALIDHVEAHRDGVSRMLLNSSRHRLGNQPSGNERTTFSSANATGTTNDPRLVIEHEEAGVEGTASADLGGVTATATGTATTTVEGTAETDLGDIAAQATGQRSTPGTATTNLGQLDATATGNRLVTGTATTNLGTVDATATGLVNMVLVATLWAATLDTIHRIDAADGTILDTIPTPGSDTRGVAVDPHGHLWTADRTLNKIYRIDPSNGNVEHSIDAPDTVDELGDITFDGDGNLRAVDVDGGTSADLQYILDPTDGTILATHQFHSFATGGIEWHNDSLWRGRVAIPAILELTNTGGSIVETIDTQVTVRALVVDADGHMWTATASGTTATLVDLDDGSTIRTITCPASIQGFGFQVVPTEGALHATANLGRLLATATGRVAHTATGSATLAGITATAFGVLPAPWEPPPGPHDMPDVRVEIAWENSPLDDTPTWTRVDGVVCPRRLSVTRGARMRTGELETGVARCLVDNRGRQIDPNNTASPWYPNVLPRRPIRFTLLPEGGDPVVVFTGFIDRLEPWWTIGDGTVEITAVDLLGVLSSAPSLPSVVQIETLESGAKWYWPLTDTGGTVAQDLLGDRDGAYAAEIAETKASLLPYSSTSTMRCWSAIQRFSAAVLPTQFGVPQDDEVTIRFWMRLETWADAALIFTLGNRTAPTPGPWTSDKVALVLGGTEETPTLTIWLGAANDTPVTNEFSAAALADGLAHHVVITLAKGPAGQGTSRVYLDGVEVHEDINHGGTIDFDDMMDGATPLNLGADLTGSTDAAAVFGHVAWWDKILTPSEIVADYSHGVAPWDGDTTGERLDRWLDVIGVPDALRDIDVGVTVCSPARGEQRPLDALAQIAATEGGALFVAADGRLTFRHRPPFDAQATDHQFDGVPSAGAIPYADIRPTYGADRVVNVVEITRDDGPTERRESSTWKALLGELAATLNTLHATPDDARAHADWLLARSAEPRTVLESVDLRPRHPDVPTGDVLSLELAEIVEVTARPTGGGDLIVQRARVDRIEHTWDWQGWDWTTRVGLDQWPLLIPDDPDDEALALAPDKVWQYEVDDTDWADADDPEGFPTATAATDPAIVGQQLDGSTYRLYQLSVAFDLTLWRGVDFDLFAGVELVATSDQQAVDDAFSVEVAIIEPVAGISTAQWRRSAQLQLDASAGSLVTSLAWTSDETWVWPTSNAFLDAVSASRADEPNRWLVARLTSSRQRTQDQPTGDETALFDPTSFRLRLVPHTDS